MVAIALHMTTLKHLDLGYGDVAPVVPIARVIVILEAMAGMFYLAIGVASMVGTMKHGK